MNPRKKVIEENPFLTLNYDFQHQENQDLNSAANITFREEKDGISETDRETEFNYHSKCLYKG